MGRKILLIEDDRETASYLAKGLGQEGHSVEQANNGQDGLFRATDGSFDLIVLDRMLPGLDGLSVLKALRAAQIDTPILMPVMIPGIAAGTMMVVMVWVFDRFMTMAERSTTGRILRIAFIANSAIGMMPCMTPKAIRAEMPRPKTSRTTGYRVTFGSE